MPNLLTDYSIAGLIPVLSPLKPYPVLQKLLKRYIVDTWQSATRIANFVRKSKKVRLFIIHSKDDYEIPWLHAEGLFAAAANATTEGGMDVELFAKMKARTTVDMGDGAFISTWKAGGDKVIREEVFAYGRKYSNFPINQTLLTSFRAQSTSNLRSSRFSCLEGVRS
jgi:hypothetical protein